MTTSQSELEIFLEDLSVFFPISSTRNKSEVIEHYAKYLLKYCEKKNFKFSQVKKYIIENYTKTNFPEVTFIRNSLPQGEIRNYQTTIHDGELVVITLPDGRIYNFTVTGNEVKSINDIKQEIETKFGTFPKIEIYPKGTIIIGNKIYESEEC